MFVHLRGLLAGLSGKPRASQRQRPKTARPRVCQPEALEQRLALSTFGASATPMGCCCPACMGDSYVLAGQQPGQTSPRPGYKWNQSSTGAPTTITYSYSNLLDGQVGGGLSAAEIRSAIQEALSQWAARTPLNFVEVADSGPAPSGQDYSAGTPMLRFGHRPIDGSYNVLAYGYYPGGTGLAGDIQFDSTENWKVDPRLGIDLLEVATHEVGHALGLAHEPMPSSGGQQAIMNPVYAGRYLGLGTSFLYADDVHGIRAVYGAGNGSVTPLVAAPPGLEASITGPSTVIRQSSVVVGFANVRSGQHFAYDFNNDGVWEIGNGTYAGSPTATNAAIPAQYVGSPRTLVVHGRVILSDGRSRDTYHTINVTGLPPVVQLPSGGAMHLTDRLVVGGAFGDPDSSNWRVVVDYGDGTGEQVVERNGTSFVLNHGYANPGTYAITVWVSDDTGAVGTARMEVTVLALSPQTLLVRNLFENVLGRKADPEAEVNYSSALVRGVPVEVVASAIWNSDEARARRLNEYYQQIMGRNIDAGGLASWLANMRAGMTDENVIKALVASPEFINANPANADYVRVVFRFVLARDVDPSGLANWAGHLDRGMSRADLVATVMQSAECQSNLMEKYFRLYLGRSIGPSDGHAWRPGANPNLTTASLAMAILQSQEFRNHRWWV